MRTKRQYNKNVKWKNIKKDIVSQSFRGKCQRTNYQLLHDIRKQSEKVHDRKCDISYDKYCIKKNISREI